VGLGFWATTFSAKGTHSVVAKIDVHEMILANEEFRSFTLPDSSEEEQERKNVDYGSLLVWLAIGGDAIKRPSFAGRRVCETIGHGPRDFEEHTTS
jgi:hypothetical protein